VTAVLGCRPAACRSLAVSLGSSRRGRHQRNVTCIIVNEAGLHEKVLGTVPPRPWMTRVITAVASHSNDLGWTDATA